MKTYYTSQKGLQVAALDLSDKEIKKLLGRYERMRLIGVFAFNADGVRYVGRVRWSSALVVVVSVKKAKRGAGDQTIPIVFRLDGQDVINVLEHGVYVCGRGARDPVPDSVYIPAVNAAIEVCDGHELAGIRDVIRTRQLTQKIMEELP